MFDEGTLGNDPLVQQFYPSDEQESICQGIELLFIHPVLQLNSNNKRMFERLRLSLILIE